MKFHQKYRTYVVSASATNTFSTKLASELLSENQGKVLLIGLDEA